MESGAGDACFYLFFYFFLKNRLKYRANVKSLKIVFKKKFQFKNAKVSPEWNEIAQSLSRSDYFPRSYFCGLQSSKLCQKYREGPSGWWRIFQTKKVAWTIFSSFLTFLNRIIKDIYFLNDVENRYLYVCTSFSLQNYFITMP